MFKLHHKIYENGGLRKDELKDETRDIEAIVELQLVKILNELKTKKLMNPKTNLIDESIAVVNLDIERVRTGQYKYHERKILAGDNYYEYKFNLETHRYHFYKKRNGGDYISIRDYFHLDEVAA